MRGQIILSLFGMMEFWSLVLAVFLGAVAVSSEIKNRTILSVLSRPVERWQFFLAKWLGTLGFLVVFLGAGAIVGVALSHHWQLDPSPLFALGVAELFVRLAVFSGVSIGLSSLVNPVVAGGGAVLVIFLGELSSMLREHPIRVLRYLGEGGYFLSPAGMPENLLESGLTKGVIEPSYGLYGAVIAENMLYALAVVVAGALLFSRRELIVK
jgi:ABC-type transport system involved in multi-copper enzyme maturation permease subunit